MVFIQLKHDFVLSAYEISLKPSVWMYKVTILGINEICSTVLWDLLDIAAGLK